MQESNELNDIILNKGGSAGNNKKIILAIATLGVILIIVIMLMSSLTSNGTDNLPQTPIPPQPKPQVEKIIENEPLFEDVEVVQEDVKNNSNLDQIAKRLKEESKQQEAIDTPPLPFTPEPVVKPTPKPVVKKAPVVTDIKPAKLPASQNVTHYIQVGSFSKYSPDKKFLKSITDLGYPYTFHKVTKNGKTLNKVLVGPFKTIDDAKNARRLLRAKVEPGAFLTKI